MAKTVPKKPARKPAAVFEPSARGKAIRHGRKTAGTTFRTRREKIGISRNLFADIANCSLRKMATYEASEELPLKVERQLTEAIRLAEALAEILDDGLLNWLETPNPGFDGRAPIEAITSGESDLLWDMIHQSQQLAYS